MTGSLKPYPTYKDSGVPWLGKIPEHWAEKRAKHFFREVDERSMTGEEELLSVSHLTGVTPRSQKNVTMFQAESTVGHKLCQPGDVVVNTMWAWMAALGVAKQAGLVSPSYGVYRPRRPAAFLPELVDELLRTPAYVSEYTCRSTGITTSRLRLYPEQFLRIPLLGPPLQEQRLIMRFVAAMNRRIRRYIRAKQTLIELLEEQKQAIIHRAVTRGLDRGVRLKPSGVEWIGDVPEHWEVMPLRRVTASRCDGPFGSGLKSSHYTDQGIRVVRLQNIGHAAFKDSAAAFISPLYYATLGDHTVEPGDLLIAGLGDERHPAGRACVAPSFIGPAMVKADCFRFRLFRQRLDPEFAAQHLTATAVNASSLLSTGATRQRTNLQSTASRSIAVPPPKEQLAIVQYIKRETSSLRLAVASADREIALVREYRIRLIADVVTGKLDVREAAARLPDEPEEPEELGVTADEVMEESDIADEAEESMTADVGD